MSQCHSIKLTPLVNCLSFLVFIDFDAAWTCGFAGASLRREVCVYDHHKGKPRTLARKSVSSRRTSTMKLTVLIERAYISCPLFITRAALIRSIPSFVRQVNQFTHPSRQLTDHRCHPMICFTTLRFQGSSACSFLHLPAQTHLSTFLVVFSGRFCRLTLPSASPSANNVASNPPAFF